MSEVEFIDGFIAKKPHPNAPDFVKAKISIKRQDLLDWLQKRNDEWINIDVKESKTGNWYAQVDTWQPNNGSGAGNSVQSQNFQENAPLPPEPNMDEDNFDINLKDVPF